MGVFEKRIDLYTESELDGEIVLMRLDSGEFFSIAGTGTAIWELIDGRRSRDDLVAELRGRFEGPFETIAGDVDGFLAQLTAAGLLARK